MRETVPSPLLVTHTLDPSGLMATPAGPVPTVIEVTAVVEGIVALASPDKAMTPTMANAVARTRALRKNRVLGRKQLVITPMLSVDRDLMPGSKKYTNKKGSVVTRKSGANKCILVLCKNFLVDAFPSPVMTDDTSRREGHLARQSQGKTVHEAFR